MFMLKALVMVAVGIAIPGLAWGTVESTHVMTLEGFATPECVVVDQDTGLAYVSNMNTTSEHYWQDTGAGFISRLNRDGALDLLKWVESTPDFVLHQPKGMAILDGLLYVADNSRLLAICLETGAGEAVYHIPGAERLNDVAAWRGNVYVSDTATGKVHLLDISEEERHETVAELEGVNGITVRDGVLYAVSWTLQEVFALDLNENEASSSALESFDVATHFTNLDGIEMLADGAFVVSDFTGGKIALISSDRSTVRTLYELTTPADIGIDFARNWLYVPQLEADKVVVLALEKETDPKLPLSAVRDREFDELLRQIMDRPNWNNERLAREAHRPEALVLASDKTPVDIVWRRTWALLDHLQRMDNAPDLSAEKAALNALRPRVEAMDTTENAEKYSLLMLALATQGASRETPLDGERELRDLFHEICVVRRALAFSNPLLDFDRILFLKRHKSIFEHMCDQYYGIAARPGGGLYILEDAFTDAPRARNVLADAVVEQGRLAGQRLRGGISPATLYYDGEGRLTESCDPRGGAFLSPDLSFDGERILFSYVECRGDTRHAYRTEEPGDYWINPWDPGRAYHVFKVNVDGTGLTQLTDGPWNDMHPCWLPDGRIAFVSERRGGFLRCGRVCPTYVMYQMDGDGSFIRPLSYHETHEWLPSVDNNGMIVYTRWDYVDRDSDIAHHLWLTYPDGRDPRGPHANYPRVREHRPWMQMHLRGIPDSHKYIGTAATHHGQHFGSLITIDLHIEDDHATSQLRRITPEAMFPEAEMGPGIPYSPRGQGGYGQVYGTPWPLSEDFYLAVYDPAQQHHDMYLIDGFGNRELVYRDTDIACSDPIPLKPRPTPPVIPVQTRYEPDESEQPETGLVSVMDIYDSLQPWPEGTELKELRVIQLFAKSTPAPLQPNIGAGDESIARGALGTVPIEEDGSVYFEAPAGITFYFQALDGDGLAVQTMRSATYLHPGEHLSCTGCHEPRHTAPPKRAEMPLAMRKPPAQLRPEPEGAYPLQFSRLVQPVLDANCVACHQREEHAPDLDGNTFGEHGWSQAFHSLIPFAWMKHGGNFNGIQRNKTSYSIPGDVGARASKLYPMLEAGHHDVELTPEEMRRITLWLDANSVFYGAYHDTVAQAKGEFVWPHLE